MKRMSRIKFPGSLRKEKAREQIPILEMADLWLEMGTYIGACLIVSFGQKEPHPPHETLPPVTETRRGSFPLISRTIIYCQRLRSLFHCEIRILGIWEQRAQDSCSKPGRMFDLQAGTINRTRSLHRCVTLAVSE